MDLYTSLTRLKQAMNDGQLPPMTPLSDKALVHLDPEFTIGMGAIKEDSDKGLRCPVRGCGRYYHMLGTHLSMSHKDLGGKSGVKRLLSIPRSAPLVSSTRAARMRTAALGHKEQQRAAGRNQMVRNKEDPQFFKRAMQARSKAMRTAGFKNLRDTCVAQLTHRLIDLNHKLGHSPSKLEAHREFGTGIVEAMLATFGTWNAAKAHTGLKVFTKGAANQRLGDTPYTEDMVVECFKAYYEQHGRLPTSKTANSGNTIPLLPSATTVERVFGCRWSQVMKKVAVRLNIPKKQGV